jgi:hypothetical protein
MRDKMTAFNIGFIIIGISILMLKSNDDDFAEKQKIREKAK